MITGITVTLYNKTASGTDAFNATTYTEEAETVENVLVTPAAAEDIVNDMNLYGKHLVYELCIPKGDEHTWEDRKISFMDQTFHSYGPVQEWIEDLVPLSWNRKVKVERYG